MNDLRKRILEISEKLGLSHIGSCISVLPILEDIYSKKKPEDKVLLDNAHAHLAHVIVKEYYCDTPNVVVIEPSFAEYTVNENGIHCDRKSACDATGGSLGHALGISIGFALSTPSRAVHCVVSDGSMMEGSNWEALRIIDDLKLKNIHIYCNFNGYTATAKCDTHLLEKRMRAFVDTIEVHSTYNGKGFEGVQGHYRKLGEV